MITPAALLFAAALVGIGPARAASDPAAYDAKAAPLDDLSKELLTGNGYEIRDDGKVWDKIGEAPVARTDMPYLLSRLASAKRLRALLEINNIITRYDAERKLTPEDKEAVRVLVRQNWVVFGNVPRNDFRSYFSLEELESLDKIPPRFEAMSAMTMTDPPIESVTAAPPSITAQPPAAAVIAAPAAVSSAPAASVAPAAVPVPAAPVPIVPPPAAPQALAAVASVAAASPARVIPTLTPLMELPSLKPFSPAAPSPVAAAPAVIPPAPPKEAAIVTPPAPPSTSTAASSELGTLKPWTPPAPSTTTAAVPPPVAAAVSTSTVAAAPAPPEPPKAAVIGEPEYAKFVAEGPYNKEGKAVLELIGKRAPDYCLPLLRRTVVGAVPQIVSDGARTGTELRAGFTRDAANPLAPPVVALSPGPVFVEVKQGLFGSREAVLLPESPRAWTDLGVARPPLDALRENALPLSTENGQWGAVRLYADGSRRGSYSATEMAGELLEQLLLLGLSREGLDASTYAARRWARTARLMFDARLKDETKRDDFLDPDRRAELRGWLDHPDETDDLTAAVWSGSRRQLLDPRRGPPGAALEFESRARATCVRSALEDALAESSRRRAAQVGELQSLLDAGVVDAAGVASAVKAATDAEEAELRRLVAMPPPCPAPDPAREEGLRKSVLLLAESAGAEHLMRERKSGIESHAP